METYAAQRRRLRCDCRVVYDGLCRGVVVFGTSGPAAAAGAGTELSPARWRILTGGPEP